MTMSNIFVIEMSTVTTSSILGGTLITDHPALGMKMTSHVVTSGTDTYTIHFFSFREYVVILRADYQKVYLFIMVVSVSHASRKADFSIIFL